MKLQMKFGFKKAVNGICRPAETGGPPLSCLLVPPAAGMFPAQRVIPFR